MAMNYNSLVAPKNTSGSIANWVAYTLLDIPPILEEAQALLYASLRAREMMSTFYFTLMPGVAAQALPAGFRDPIGRIWVPSLNLPIRHKDQNTVLTRRSYTNTTGTLGANPLTTALGSALVTVNLPGHGFSTESLFNMQGVTAVNGITANGTFPIVALVDVNNFTVDTSVLGQTASGSGAGGGAAITYACDNLVQGLCEMWSIWDEQLKFDTAALQQMDCQLLYFRSLPLLSPTNLSNFLTDRYPQLMRRACVAAAADFMDDDDAFQRSTALLAAMIENINVENEGQYRGMELDTMVPGHG